MRVNKLVNFAAASSQSLNGWVCVPARVAIPITAALSTRVVVEGSVANAGLKAFADET
jgi:hypothetical protein